MLTSTQQFARLSSFLGNGQSQDWNNLASVALLIRGALPSTDISPVYDSAGQATATISLATNYRLGVVIDGANVAIYVNNSVGGSGGSAPTLTWGSPGRFYVGRSPNANEHWDGPVSEIVLTNTALSSTDRDRLDNYFKNEWGL
jgi:hypothetical protein